MQLTEQIKDVLEHYDYCLVSATPGENTENVVHVKIKTTPQRLFRDMTILFGAERVSKAKGKIKIKEI